MPTYILLSTLTAQGLQTLRSNPERLREVNRDVEELGARVIHQWATLGPFDFVNVVEAPDNATIARVSVALGARGSAKLQTLFALEIEELLASLEQA
ncbi:MAG: GYD domain-containing protein [Thermoleophilia bacterium]|nr:GYD domain-containing protein [Thermoleophilia bacterium]